MGLHLPTCAVEHTPLVSDEGGQLWWRLVSSETPISEKTKLTSADDSLVDSMIGFKENRSIGNAGHGLWTRVETDRRHELLHLGWFDNADLLLVPAGESSQHHRMDSMAEEVR